MSRPPLDNVSPFGGWTPELIDLACAEYEGRARELEQMRHEAYAEGRKDEAEEHAWQPIETCPEDENVLVATTGGWVDTAFWTDDGDGPKWWWLLSASVYARHPIHPDLVPTHWMPLPKHPHEMGAPSEADCATHCGCESEEQCARRNAGVKGRT